MVRTLAFPLLALAALASGSDVVQPRDVRELASQLSASDPATRARAACDLRDLGDAAFDAVQPLVGLLADAAPVEAGVCRTGAWRGNGNDLTTPGELAAAALVAVGSRTFEPVLAVLHSPAWVARRNAAWALGALDDRRAVAGLSDTLKDREPLVRGQAAWALGAIDDSGSVPALIAALKDSDAGVRHQAAWALGAIDDARAVGPLSAALKDEDERTREQAAWALGAIGEGGAPALIDALSDRADRVRKQAAWALGAIDDRRAVDPLVRALADKSSGVREQAAWALGAIGDSSALPGLLPALKDADSGVRRQAAWAIGAIGK
jgi:HEAT repeat protein